MRAEIVSVGTELLLGTITDTNAAYLAQRLAALGIDCYYVSQVGDNLGRLVDTLRRGWERSDLVIITGGLGPTGDDLTREAISDLLGEPMTVDPTLEADLRAFFQRRGVTMPDANLKQASLIPSAQSLPNPIGTAPGWWVSRYGDGRPLSIVAMPGVPYEMRRMWEHEVEPKLLASSATIIVSRTLKVLGMGESAVEDKVKDLMTGSNPTLAPYAKQDGVHLRITAKAHNVDGARQLIEHLEEAVRARLGEAIYGIDEETPQAVVRQLLAEAGRTCGLLEIGGAVAGALAPLADSRDETSPVAGTLTVGGPSEVTRVLGEDLFPAGGSIENAAWALRMWLKTDMALAVTGTATSLDTGGRTVSAEIEIVLVDGERAGRPHAATIRQTWKTDIGEVKRLAGLAAMNMLRLSLLKRKERDS